MQTSLSDYSISIRSKTLEEHRKELKTTYTSLTEYIHKFDVFLVDEDGKKFYEKVSKFRSCAVAPLEDKQMSLIGNALSPGNFSLPSSQPMKSSMSLNVPRSVLVASLAVIMASIIGVLVMSLQNILDPTTAVDVIALIILSFFGLIFGPAILEKIKEMRVEKPTKAGKEVDLTLPNSELFRIALTEYHDAFYIPRVNNRVEGDALAEEDQYSTLAEQDYQNLFKDSEKARDKKGKGKDKGDTNGAGGPKNHPYSDKFRIDEVAQAQLALSRKLDDIFGTIYERSENSLEFRIEMNQGQAAGSAQEAANRPTKSDLT